VATRDNIVVLVTCGTASEAERIARALVEKRLAACVNLFESIVRSIYRWKGRIESAPEHLLIIKTTRRRLPDLQKEVERLHSYDVPEVIALSVTAGGQKYLDWLGENVRVDRAAASRRKSGASVRPAPEQAEEMKPLDLLPEEEKKPN